MFQSKCNRQKRLRRAGTAVVEFAIIAPLMILFTFGLVEISRLMLVKQTATHATREGARIAVRPTATSTEVTQRVYNELSLLSIHDAEVSIEPTMIENAPPGTPVTVRVAIGISSVSWIPGVFDFGITDIVAESSMRRETTN